MWIFVIAIAAAYGLLLIYYIDPMYYIIRTGEKTIAAGQHEDQKVEIFYATSAAMFLLLLIVNFVMFVGIITSLAKHALKMRKIRGRNSSGAILAQTPGVLTRMKK